MCRVAYISFCNKKKKQKKQKPSSYEAIKAAAIIIIKKMNLKYLTFGISQPSSKNTFSSVNPKVL